jgi:hypothetical protein
VYNCHNKIDLDRHFKETDDLYERIKKSGYQMQSELLIEKKYSLVFEDEISVHIDHNGHYLFGDGRHRYFIAKLIGLKRIPVKIARRHAEWVKFRQRILNYAAQEMAKVYQPICIRIWKIFLLRVMSDLILLSHISFSTWYSS